MINQGCLTAFVAVLARALLLTGMLMADNALASGRSFGFANHLPTSGLGETADQTPSLSTSGETLTIEESMTLRARTENAGHGDEHEWSWSGG